MSGWSLDTEAQLGLVRLPDIFIKQKSDTLHNDIVYAGDDETAHPHDRLNALALKNRAWAEALYPQGSEENDGSWRIRSEELGRDYEEALSIHPTGIYDFGPDYGLTALQLIQRDGEHDPDDTEGAISYAPHDEWEKGKYDPRVSEDVAAEWLAQILNFDLEVAWKSYRNALFAESGSESGFGKEGLRLSFLHDLDNLPDINDFVQGTFFNNQLSVIFGPPGSGKTFAALDLSLCVSLGRNWHDKQVEQGSVLYIALEGVHGIKRRFKAWCQYYGVSENEPCIGIIDGFLNLGNDKKARQQIIEYAQQAEEHFGKPVLLIVIDTLSRAMAGGNENDSKDMGALVMGADEIRKKTGAHVSIIHHGGKNKDSGSRGHSLLLGNIDTEIKVTPKKNESLMTLTKQKEGETGPLCAFKVTQVTLPTYNKWQERNTSAVALPTVIAMFEECESDLNETQMAGYKIIRKFLEAGPMIRKKLKTKLLQEGWPPKDEIETDDRTKAATDRAFDRLIKKLKDEDLVYESSDGMVSLKTSEDTDEDS